MMRAFVIGCLAVVGMVPAMANAQDVMPLGLEYEFVPDDPALALWEFSYCAAERYPVLTSAFLDSAPRSSAERERRQDLVGQRGSSCVERAAGPGAQIPVAPRALRGYLAEGSYIREFPNGPPETVTGLSTGQISGEQFLGRMESALSQDDELIRIFAECVVRSAPRTVDDMARSGFRSPEELRLINSMSEHFGPCLWENQSIEFGREDLRAALSEALYRAARTTVATVQYSEASE